MLTREDPNRINLSENIRDSVTKMVGESITKRPEELLILVNQELKYQQFITANDSEKLGHVRDIIRIFEGLEEIPPRYKIGQKYIDKARNYFTQRNSTDPRYRLSQNGIDNSELSWSLDKTTYGMSLDLNIKMSPVPMLSDQGEIVYRYSLSGMEVSIVDAFESA
jgi:hypothetical protein